MVWVSHLKPEHQDARGPQEVTAFPTPSFVWQNMTISQKLREDKESLPLSQLQIKTPKRENLDCPSLCLMSPSFGLECHDKQYQLGCLPLGVVFVMGRFEGHPW